MAITRKGSAKWSGGLKDGKGQISTESGAIDGHPYGFAMRFEGVKGTNPEELIGAAHAGCFSMALSNILGQAGYTADSLEATSAVDLEQTDGGFVIPRVKLTLKASIPGIDDAEFQKLAAEAKAGCPVSKLLNAEITLDATLA